MRKVKLTKEQLEAALQELPLVDQVWILTSVVINSRKGRPLGAVLALVELVGRMSSYFSEAQRYQIAEKIRTTADRCEVAGAFDVDAERTPL
jgi:hypothetical protein